MTWFWFMTGFLAACSLLIVVLSSWRRKRRSPSLIKNHNCNNIEGEEEEGGKIPPIPPRPISFDVSDLLTDIDIFLHLLSPFNRNSRISKKK